MTSILQIAETYDLSAGVFFIVKLAACKKHKVKYQIRRLLYKKRFEKKYSIKNNVNSSEQIT